MVSKAEIAKDIAQTAVESGAKHVGRSAVIIAGTVGGVAKDIAGIVTKPTSGIERVGGIVTRIAGCVSDVAGEVGTFATDMFEIADAAKRAHKDSVKADAEDQDRDHDEDPEPAPPHHDEHPQGTDPAE
jgi:hypothetical protein